jgi:hypothetical protein
MNAIAAASRISRRFASEACDARGATTSRFALVFRVRAVPTRAAVFLGDGELANLSIFLKDFCPLVSGG